MGISKQMQMEEMHRVSIEEYDEDGRAKNDDAAFCAKENHDSDMRRQYDNNVIGSFIPGLQPYMAEGFANTAEGDELVEVIESLQKKAENDNE
tara:strand:+ start:427 stop:705 length:279 start_codon:yes stop_codon:yes gene_type:complete